MVIPYFLSGQYTLVQDESEFKRKTREITENSLTMTSDFIQEKHLSFMSEPIITKGKFRYKKPNRVRWEYTEPFSYILIINEDQLLIDDEGHQNKIDLGNNDMFKQINKIVSNALMGKVMDDSEQFAHTLEASETEFKINLVPIDKSLEKYIKTIEVYFDKKTLIVSSVMLEESSEDYTKIKFINKVLNAPIEDQEFELNN